VATGEVEKSARFSCEISLDLMRQKLSKSANFDRVIQQIKGGRFGDTVYIYFVGEIPTPKKNNSGGVNRRFQTKRAKY